MTDVEPFGVIIAVVAAVMMVAVLSNRISERIRVPAPAFFLVAAAVVSDLVPALSATDRCALQLQQMIWYPYKMKTLHYCPRACGAGDLQEGISVA